MENILFISGSAVVGLIVLFVLGLMVAKLYQRSSKEVAFVRTGAGGPKVIKDGGALILPVFHDVTKVNMNTMKLTVNRKETEALITFDRMRVDVGVEFYVRVKQDEAAISMAAQTLGSKTMEPSQLRDLVEGKFVDALRSVASAMTMKDLHEKRSDFVNKVQTAVMTDLEKNGLELESVSLTSFDQTNRKFFNADNAFDAEGLTLLTREIENRKKLRNEIERDTQLQMAQKDLETEREQTKVRQEATFVKLNSEKEIAFTQAAQEAEISRVKAEQSRAAETATIEAERVTEKARIEKDREVQSTKIEMEKDLQQKNIDKESALRQAQIEQDKKLKLAEQDKLIVIAKKSEEEASAKASSEKARAEQVKATEDVTTIAAVAEAERQQQIELIGAESLAKKESVKLVVAAQAEEEVAKKKSSATLILAKAQTEADVLASEGIKAKYTAEAEGQTQLNEAANKQSADVIAMQVKLKLIEKLPEIIRESVKPMEKIDSIKIVDMGGSVQSLSGGAVVNADGSTSGGGQNFPDQIMNAVSRHKMAAPLIDDLLAAAGISEGDIQNEIRNTMGANAGSRTKTK